MKHEGTSSHCKLSKVIWLAMPTQTSTQAKQKQTRYKLGTLDYSIMQASIPDHWQGGKKKVIWLSDREKNKKKEKQVRKRKGNIAHGTTKEMQDKALDYNNQQRRTAVKKIASVLRRSDQQLTQPRRNTKRDLSRLTSSALALAEPDG